MEAHERQGTFTVRLRVFKLNTFTAGSGGSGAIGNCISGGGGGGVQMNDEGSNGVRGLYANTFGGNGYGAGGTYERLLCCIEQSWEFCKISCFRVSLVYISLAPCKV